jgi:hypothetical protein
MKIKITVLFVLAALFWAPAVSGQTGLSLLDRVVTLINDSAKPGWTPGDPRVKADIDGMLADARKAKDQGSIDSFFFLRYTRLLKFLGLAVSSGPADAFLLEEAVQFVIAVKGGGPGLDTEELFLDEVADAIAREIRRLRNYVLKKDSATNGRKELA